MSGEDGKPPVFDWDPKTLRITWANGPAVAFWSAGSQAELLNRPFSAREDTARVLTAQSELLNESDVSEGWFILSPAADPFLCKALRSPGAALPSGRA